MATHPEAIKWELLVEDDGDDCVLNRHGTKPQCFNEAKTPSYWVTPTDVSQMVPVQA